MSPAAIIFDLQSAQKYNLVKSPSNKGCCEVSIWIKIYKIIRAYNHFMTNILRSCLSVSNNVCFCLLRSLLRNWALRRVPIIRLTKTTFFESQVVYVLLYVFKRVRKGQLNDIFDKFLHKCMCGSEHPVLEKYSITKLRESDPWLWHIIFVIKFLSPYLMSRVSLVCMLLLFEPPWIRLVTININNYIYVVVWNVLLISSS